MYLGTKLKIVIVVSLALIFLKSAAFGDVPAVNQVMVTDVTPFSFSVIWAASEESFADIVVYGDENGTLPANNAIVTPHPVESGDASIKTAAENKGVMKVRVTGIEPDTTYYFKTITTSKSTDQTTYSPTSGPFPAVTTEAEIAMTVSIGERTVPLSNDLIIKECYLDDGLTPAEGTLLVAIVKDSSNPITAFVGDGLELPYAMIDLNNIFSRESSHNLELVGGENLTLINFRGRDGISAVTHDIPEDLSVNEVKAPVHALKAGWNLISLPLQPADTAFQSVLNPVWDKVSSIWAYDQTSDQWLRYDKNNPFPWLNDLELIESLRGYWLLVDSPTSLPVSGAFVTDSTINLQTGWNLIGSRSIETLSLSEALVPIYDQLISIWTYETAQERWFRFDKSGPFPELNDLEFIEPGKAYWVNVSESCTW